MLPLPALPLPAAPPPPPDVSAAFFLVLRLKSRRGPKKAIVAVAASMLTAAYFMLRDGVEYADLGGTYFAYRDIEETKNRLLRRLRDLGVEVEVKVA